MKFFDKMLTVFFARQNPDSTSANPRFMKNTRDAVINTHIVSMPIFRSAGVCANAGVVPASDISAPAAKIPDRKSTRLNSSHSQISYAVFCLKKKKKKKKITPLQNNKRQSHTN